MAKSSKDLVIVLTPTFNRRWIFPLAIHCFKSQTHAHKKWIILDDSDPGQDVAELVAAAGFPPGQVRYERVTTGKMTVGAKRNALLDMALQDPDCDFLAWADDDDYYFPGRLNHAYRCLKTLEARSQAVHLLGCARFLQVNAAPGPAALDLGKLPLYVMKEDEKTWGPYHATAGTWVFRKALLADGRRFPEDASFAEESSFLRGFRTPMLQIEDPLKVMVVLNHGSNTVDRTVRKDERMTKFGMTLKSVIDRDALNIIQDAFKGRTA